jgi:hypothetical protein
MKLEKMPTAQLKSRRAEVEAMIAAKWRVSLPLSDSSVLTPLWYAFLNPPYFTPADIGGRVRAG